MSSSSTSPPPPPRPPSSSAASFAELRPVDVKVWRGCAGACVQIPLSGSRVYYFPQGHLEQLPSQSPPILSPLALSRPSIPCLVSSVFHFADPITDEVLVKFHLQPESSAGPLQQRHGSLVRVGGSGGGGELEEEVVVEKIVSFAKTLTPSDANNGGGFSVPRFCADTIFPRLDFDADPPVQNLSVKDVHGKLWNFRHIYRGTPRRHLLTTGWSKFVNSKKLVAGDSVVFMRNSEGEMFVGIRRAVRNSCVMDCTRWREQIGGGRSKVNEDSSIRDGFSRNGRGRVSMEAVVNAVETAARGLPFEVVYYPRTECSDFVVKAELVEEAMKVFWTDGMRIKMALESEDCSRLTWHQGVVSSVIASENGLWPGSPWRMLQVAWDEPEAMLNRRSVSPWQVECIAPTSAFDCAYPPVKKLRIPAKSDLGADGDASPFFPMAGFSSSMRPFNSLVFDYNTPVGMQGARQDASGAFTFGNYAKENAPMHNGGIFGINMVPRSKAVSTELNIGSSASETLSTDSPSSGLSLGTELPGNQRWNAADIGISSFQLFGKIIHAKKPVESSLDGGVGKQNDGSKGPGGTGYVNKPPDLTLTCLEAR